MILLMIIVITTSILNLSIVHYYSNYEEILGCLVSELNHDNYYTTIQKYENVKIP